MADRALAFVSRRGTTTRVVLWLLLFPFLLPLLIVARTGGSRGGLIAAGSLFAIILAMGAAGGEPADEEAPTAGVTTDELASPDGPASPSPTPSPSATSPPSPSPTATRDASAQPSTEPSSPTAEPASTSPRGDDAPVVRQGRVAGVVDGDTIDLADGTRVRLAITDTPEVHGGTEACGPEASHFTASFVAGQAVAIYRPDDAPRQDSFDRLLGEVVRVTDGASLNVALVRSGLGIVDERFVDEDPDVAGRLREAAAGAQVPSCAANDEPEPAPEPPTEPDDATTASGAHNGNVDGGYDCHPAYEECLPQVGDLNCGDIGHSVSLFGSSDPYGLDREGDRAGCESEPAWSPSASYPYY